MEMRIVDRVANASFSASMVFKDVPQAQLDFGAKERIDEDFPAHFVEPLEDPLRLLAVLHAAVNISLLAQNRRRQESAGSRRAVQGVQRSGNLPIWA